MCKFLFRPDYVQPGSQAARAHVAWCAALTQVVQAASDALVHESEQHGRQLRINAEEGEQDGSTASNEHTPSRRPELPNFRSGGTAVAPNFLSGDGDPRLVVHGLARVFARGGVPNEEEPHSFVVPLARSEAERASDEEKFRRLLQAVSGGLRESFIIDVFQAIGGSLEAAVFQNASHNTLGRAGLHESAVLEHVATVLADNVFGFETTSGADADNDGVQPETAEADNGSNLPANGSAHEENPDSFGDVGAGSADLVQGVPDAVDLVNISLSPITASVVDVLKKITAFSGPDRDQENPKGQRMTENSFKSRKEDKSVEASTMEPRKLLCSSFARRKPRRSS